MDVIDVEGFFPTSTTTWGSIFRGYDDEGSPTNHEVAAKTISETAVTATTANREAHDGDSSTTVEIRVALVIGSTVGSPLNRVAVDGGGPFQYLDSTSRYLLSALFNLTGFTPVSSSVNRDGTVLAWDSAGESRICTWDGAAPIGDDDDETGPTFEGDFGVTETLLWIFGL
jgi:hypothetical protein